jgi:hypothetical protein
METADRMDVVVMQLPRFYLDSLNVSVLTMSRFVAGGVRVVGSRDGFSLEESFGPASATPGYGIRHTCTTFPGFSGCPILNLKGEVVGIHTGARKDETANDGTAFVDLILRAKKSIRTMESYEEIDMAQASWRDIEDLEGRATRFLDRDFVEWDSSRFDFSYSGPNVAWADYDDEELWGTGADYSGRYGEDAMSILSQTCGSRKLMDRLGLDSQTLPRSRVDADLRSVNTQFVDNFLEKRRVAKAAQAETNRLENERMRDRAALHKLHAAARQRQQHKINLEKFERRMALRSTAVLTGLQTVRTTSELYWKRPMLDFGSLKTNPILPRTLSVLSLDSVTIGGEVRQLPIFSTMTEALRLMGQLRKELRDLQTKSKPSKNKASSRSSDAQSIRVQPPPAQPLTPEVSRNVENFAGPHVPPKEPAQVSPPTAPFAQGPSLRMVSGELRRLRPRRKNLPRVAGTNAPTWQQMVTFMATSQHQIRDPRPGQVEKARFYDRMSPLELSELYDQKIAEVRSRKQWRRQENALLNVRRGFATPNPFAPLAPRQVLCTCVLCRGMRTHPFPPIGPAPPSL